MQIQYYPFDFSTSQNNNRRETEREYFMRLVHEQAQDRLRAKRQANQQKLKAALRAALNLFTFKRTPSLETLLGR